MTLRTTMRFGDFSKNISKPLDRNELTQEERDFLLARHISGLNKSEIARKNGASRNYVDRVLLSAEKKLYAYLKYPVMMRFSLICPPESIFDEIKEYL